MAEKTEPPKYNHVGCWIDLRKEVGLATIVTGQEARASKQLFADLGSDPERFKAVIRAYLADRAFFLVNTGWPMAYVNRGLQRYATTASPPPRPVQMTPEMQWEKVAAHWLKVGHEVAPGSWSPIELAGIRAAVVRMGGIPPPIVDECENEPAPWE